MLYCGIDVAKHKHSVALLNEKGQVLQPAFTITNTRAGFDQLRQVFQGLAEPLTIGLEATCHYWLALYEELIQPGAEVTVIVLNRLQVATYRKSGVRKVKNDRSDAVWIADFVRIANLPPTHRDMPVLLQLRELSRFRVSGLRVPSHRCTPPPPGSARRPARDRWTHHTCHAGGTTSSIPPPPYLALRRWCIHDLICFLSPPDLVRP